MSRYGQIIGDRGRLPEFFSVEDGKSSKLTETEDWPTVHWELKRKHMTLVIVWEEYIAADSGGYNYSRFVGSIAALNGSCRRRCSRCMWPASGCSSIMPAMGFLSPSTGYPSWRAAMTTITADQLTRSDCLYPTVDGLPGDEQCREQPPAILACEVLEVRVVHPPLTHAFIG